MEEEFGFIFVRLYNYFEKNEENQENSLAFLIFLEYDGTKEVKTAA